MADDALTDDFDTELEEFGQTKRMSGKKLVLFIILPVLLLGAASGALYGGLLGGGDDEEPAKHAKDAKGDSHAKPSKGAKHGAAPTSDGNIFYDLPQILVNLNTNSRRPTFLKITLSLELTDSHARSRIEELRPRIIDNFQVYLRELRVEDLRGSAGIYRLREELLARINLSVHPAKVKSVLFKEILIQ